MFQVLKLLHMVGWAAWFGLAIAEASVGVQARKATDAGGRTALARLWGRIGRIEVLSMAVAVVFGLAVLGYYLATWPQGPGDFMRQKGFLYVHIMLALGLVGGVLALLAAQARGRAVSAMESGDGEGFTAGYKRAAMFSGMMSLCLLATIVEVYLRSL